MTAVPGGWTWEQMLDEFRAIGGVADNVCRRRGKNGWGIFPNDARRPVCIHVPENLLLATDLVVFDDDTLRVRRCDTVGEREAAFVERYQAEFSWGAGGRAECAGFVAAMDTLPDPLRRILTAEFGFGSLFSETASERVLKQFLGSRCIWFNGKRTLIPVLELVNHGGTGARFEVHDGISIKGTFAAEVLARYRRLDPIGFFRSWGFASPEPFAYSLPALLSVDSRVLAIRRRFNRGAIGDNAPAAKLNGKVIEVTNLLLGNIANPGEPQRIFLQLMAQMEVANADAVFHDVLQLNRTRLQQLISALDSDEGEILVRLREACRLQLDALSSAG